MAALDQDLTSESRPLAAVQQPAVGVWPLDFREPTRVEICSSEVATTLPPVAFNKAVM